MTERHEQADSAIRLRAALDAPDSSMRLQAALTAGTRPAPEFIDVLVARCAVEPDFYVRDMLTWALIHQERAATMERLLPELRSEIPQARSQAMHTLSKVGDPAAWPAIPRELLTDSDDEVARAAWRAAVGLAPAEDRRQLADVLGTQFARGDRDVQLSLSRALAELGVAAEPTVDQAKTHPDEAVRVHAVATERIMQDPAEGFDAAMHEAKRAVALRGAPQADG